MADEIKPTVDASLDNSAFEDVTKFRLVKGVEADLTLKGHDGPSRWISENDPVLKLIVTGNDAHITAEELGESTIFIMEKTAFGEQPKVIKELLINVVPEIVQPVSDLGITVALVDKP